MRNNALIIAMQMAKIQFSILIDTISIGVKNIKIDTPDRRKIERCRALRIVEILELKEQGVLYLRLFFL